MLRVGVVGRERVEVDAVVARFADLAAGAVHDGDGGVEVVAAAGNLDRFHLVLGCGAELGRGRFADDVDLWVDRPALAFCGTTSADPVESLWRHRLVPWAENLRAGRRAPRRRTAVIVEPDPTWPAQAARLIGRLRHALGPLAVRIDHIGSTSVPGLGSKDLVDLQVVVADLAAAARAADAAADAGFVRVGGAWFGPGSEGAEHREEVCVDADPGRPVNVNLRPFASPVWRDALRFRDLLRSSADERGAYEAMKCDLASRTDLDVDGYGAAKAAYVTAALARSTSNPTG